MTKQEYWNAHVARNPGFADEGKKIQMSVQMLRRLLEEAYDKGFEHNKNKSRDFADILKDIASTAR